MYALNWPKLLYSQFSTSDCRQTPAGPGYQKPALVLQQEAAIIVTKSV